MTKTWCPTCAKPARMSLDSFPALCGDCRQPYLVEQMVTWHQRNTVFAAAPDLLAACEVALECADMSGAVRAMLMDAVKKARGGA